MRKPCVLLFSISLLALSLYGLLSHSFYVQILIDLSTPSVIVRAVLALALAAYAFAPCLRLDLTKALLGIGGATLMLLGLISVGSPTLLGHANSYILIGDTITLIEGGILAVLLSAELPARRSQLMDKGMLYIKSVLATRANTPPRLSHQP